MGADSNTGIQFLYMIPVYFFKLLSTLHAGMIWFYAGATWYQVQGTGCNLHQVYECQSIYIPELYNGSTGVLS